MKNRLYLVVVIFSMVVFGSCEKDNSETGNQITSADVAEIKATAMDGEWRITYYFDTDKEETTDYSGYVFSFNADGSLIASNGSVEVVGVWSVTNSDSSDDDDSGDVDFNISFTSPANFEELTDDWDILEYSSTIIKLTDVSGGNGGTDYLTFEKN